MIVGDHMVPQEPSNSCQCVPEVRRSDMPDVHRLRNIRRAEINDNCFRLCYRFHAKMRIESQLLKSLRKKLRGKPEIDKARTGDFSWLGNVVRRKMRDDPRSETSGIQRQLLG